MIQIQEVRIEPDRMFDTISAQGQLSGMVTAKVANFVTVNFPLSPDSITTIKECIERDYDEYVVKPQLGGPKDSS
jgi:histidinol-phosphate/aromatic aminotransferase/cobyric acid decarboxylase-like protein